MGDFVNYTPGEYAKEHIRITPTTLADGRDFLILTTIGIRLRRQDPRTEGSAPTSVPFLQPAQRGRRGNAVRGSGNAPRPADRRLDSDGDRTYEPSDHRRSGATAKGNPLAARKPGDPYQDGEVPDPDYNVVVFENRFPSMVACRAVPKPWNTSTVTRCGRRSSLQAAAK